MKRVFKGLMLVLITILMLSILAGCGTSTENNDSNESRKTSNETTNQTKKNSEEEKDNEATSSSNIKSIKKFTDAGYSFVTYSDNTIGIIDSSLKSVYKNAKSINDADSAESGYITFYSYSQKTSRIGYYDSIENAELKTPSYITDLNGKTIIEAQTGVYYTNVSKSGFVGVRTDTESLNGVTSTYKIMDLNKNVVFSETEDIIVYLGNDMFFTSSNILFNAKTKQQTSYENEDLFAMEFFNNVDYGILYTGTGILSDYYIINLDTTKGSKIEKNEEFTVLSYEKKYMLTGTDSSKEEGKITKFDGTVIRDLSEGGFEKISYKDDKFAVISKTGYYYVVNSSGEYIVEPVKIEEKYKNRTVSGTNLYTIADNTLYCYDAKEKSYKELYKLDTSAKLYVLTNLNNENLLNVMEYENESDYREEDNIYNKQPKRNIYIDTRTNKEIKNI